MKPVLIELITQCFHAVSRSDPFKLRADEKNVERAGGGSWTPDTRRELIIAQFSPVHVVVLY